MGRPPKFTEPRRPVTLTLPDRTLEMLESIHPDRARAIVKAVESTSRVDVSSSKSLQVVEVSPGVGLIIVGPSRYLRRIPWLRLVEIAPARFLLAVPSGTEVDALEIALGDLIEDIDPAATRERSLLKELKLLVRRIRRGQMVTKSEILFVDLDALHRPA